MVARFSFPGVCVTHMTRKSRQVRDVTIRRTSLFRHSEQKSVREAILCKYNQTVKH